MYEEYRRNHYKIPDKQDPRVTLVEELEHYGTARDLLLSVRPGITGAWAVSGRHGVGYPERCDIELAYVRRWTLLSDASALARTVGAVVRPGG